MSSSGDAETVTVSSLESGERPVILIGFPLLGALLGWGVGPVATWASGIAGLPFGRFTDLIAGWDSPWAIATMIAVGTAAGIGFALYAIHDAVKVLIRPTSLQLMRADKTSTLARDEIDAIFVESKQLIVLDQQSAELAREPFDANPQKLAAALRHRGYPWFDADPYASAYRRWLDGAPELTHSENFVLRTREKALAEDEREEVADLRLELTKLGLVVRDDGHRQYWRRAR